jgi:hypothetical protein
MKGDEEGKGPAMEDESRGKVDLVACLYIVGGIPALVGFIVLLFAFTRSCGISA